MNNICLTQGQGLKASAEQIYPNFPSVPTHASISPMTPQWQARQIHTVFHRFTEIGQIFIIIIFLIYKINFPSWNLAKILYEWLGNSGKAILGS